MEKPYAEINDLRRTFDISKPWLNRVLERSGRQFLKAVDGVSFEIARGETFALVGESGSGKSTVARMVVGLLPPSGGDVTIDTVPMVGRASAQDRQRLRRRIQMIFQDPYASLNPRCPFANDRCRREVPALLDGVACHAIHEGRLQVLTAA